MAATRPRLEGSISSADSANFQFHMIDTMTALLCDDETLPAYELHPQGDERIRSQVWSLLRPVLTNNPNAERRREQRYPFPHLITLWPMEPDGETVSGPPITVVGKQLSERGVGFYHPQPIANRLVIVSLEKGDGRTLSFLVDIHRCRFTRQGWYESGGRLLATVNTPSRSPSRRFAG